MNRERTHPMIVDPGWLFLAAGIGIVAATVLIPAQQDVEEARWKRDVALKREEHRNERITRYEEYSTALDAREPSLIYSLAASQLNEIPADRGVIAGLGDGREANVSVFPALEPPAISLPERQATSSYLSKLATGDRSRLWLLAGGMVSILIGMLPVGRERGPDVGIE